MVAEKNRIECMASTFISESNKLFHFLEAHVCAHDAFNPMLRASLNKCQYLHVIFNESIELGDEGEEKG